LDGKVDKNGKEKVYSNMIHQNVQNFWIAKTRKGTPQIRSEILVLFPATFFQLVLFPATFFQLVLFPPPPKLLELFAHAQRPRGFHILKDSETELRRSGPNVA
jgi:hypothetical protein